MKDVSNKYLREFSKAGRVLLNIYFENLNKHGTELDEIIKQLNALDAKRTKILEMAWEKAKRKFEQASPPRDRGNE